MPIPVIDVIGQRPSTGGFENILDYRAGIGGGGIYDSLMGGFVPDLNTVDVGVSGSIGTEEDAAAATEAIIQDYVDSLLADRLTPMKPLTPEQRAAAEQAIKEGLRGFEFDPTKDKNAQKQLQDFIGGVNDTFRELTRDGVIRPEQAAKFIEGMLEAEGVTGMNGLPVAIDPSDWINRGIDYGTRTGANGALAYPDLSSLDSGGAPSAADVLGGVGSVIGSILTGGGNGSSGSGDNASSSPTAPPTPTAPATGGNTGGTAGTGVSGNEGLGTGGSYAGGTNPDGTPIMEGTGPISVRTPQEQWQDILNDPTMDVAGAVAAAELIFGNSPEGVAAVVDAANDRGVSAEDIANSSDYSLSDIIAAANATGKVFNRETNAPATVVTPPTEVIPPAPPTPTPPTVPPEGFEGETGAEVAPPVIVPPVPPQEVIPTPPVVSPPPLQQPGFEGETGSEAAPGSVNATDPDVTDPGDTGDGDDDTGNEGDGTGDGTGDGDGDGNGDGIGIDLGGLFSSVSPTPIVDDIFAIEKFKLTRPSLDITNTLFGGFRR